MNKYILIIYWTVFCTKCFFAEGKMFVGNDLDLPIKELLEKYGYPLEEHVLITPDGYVLTTHRIPHGKSSKDKLPNKRPVFFVHGMGGSSESALALGTGNSLGFLLADNGYDVWLMNSRGNYYSRGHTRLSTDNPQYWQFSWHEIGVIDVAVNIDYILKLTNQSQLDYIGHSQGSTTYFVLTSEKPEYNEKIRMHISFAPPVFLHLNKNRYGRMFARYVEQMEGLARNFNIFEGIPPEVHDVIRKFCASDKVQTCLDALQIAQDATSRYIAKETVVFATRTMPYGVSIFQTLHYLQVTESGSFRKYDFGPKENLVKYGSEIPPAYNVSKSSAPAVLMYTQRDWFASEKQINYLASLLPNVVDKYKVYLKDFGHIDFALGYNAKEVVYDHLLEILNSV